MKEKLEALDKFKEFKNKVESELGHKVKCLHVDNGWEYTSDELFEYLQTHRIQWQFTYLDTP